MSEDATQQLDRTVGLSRCAVVEVLPLTPAHRLGHHAVGWKQRSAIQGPIIATLDYARAPSGLYPLDRSATDQEDKVGDG